MMNAAPGYLSLSPSRAAGGAVINTLCASFCYSDASLHPYPPESISAGPTSAMPKESNIDLSILSAKRGLVYLTSNDWTLIADKAIRVSFKPGECIVNTGKRSHGVKTCLKGTLKVRIHSQ